MNPEFPLSLPPSSLRPASEAPAPRTVPNPFATTLERLGREVDRGERLVHGALTPGRALDPGQLIALQAGIYRYAEVVDLTSKLVDRAVTAVRTTLQSSG